MNYSWKPGSRVKADANVIGSELQRMAGVHDGRLTPAVIVEAARPEDALLHDLFEWQDSTAAEAYRQNQARYLTRSILVRVEHDDQVTEVRAFVNLVVNTQEGDEPEQEQVYVNTLVALARPAWREQILSRARREIDVLERRYQTLEELAPVFVAWGKVRELIPA